MAQAMIGTNVDVEIHDGKVEIFKQAVADIARLVEKTEPGTTMYQFFVSPDAKTARICEWYADVDAVMAHPPGRALEEHRAAVLGSSDITSIELYGAPDGRDRSVFLVLLGLVPS